MIDHVAGLLIHNNKLLVLRKRTKDNRKEYILPGGKRENNETDKQTLTREILEELGTNIISMEYFNTYYDKAVFEENTDFKQTAYVIKIEGNIEPKNEIKEYTWIDYNYKEEGILCSHTLENHTLPELIEKGYIKV